MLCHFPFHAPNSGQRSLWGSSRCGPSQPSRRTTGTQRRGRRSTPTSHRQRVTRRKGPPRLRAPVAKADGAATLWRLIEKGSTRSYPWPGLTCQARPPGAPRNRREGAGPGAGSTPLPPAGFSSAGEGPGGGGRHEMQDAGVPPGAPGDLLVHVSVASGLYLPSTNVKRKSGKHPR